MQITLSARALKDLKVMPSKDSAAILDKLEAYAATGVGDVKKLTGSPYHRLRHGDWRAIFSVENGVLVLRVLHRREAYR